MADIYKRPDSPYWWVKFKHPDGTTCRQSTKVPLRFRDQAKLRASVMEADAWERYRTGASERTEYTFEQLMVEWIRARRPGTAELNCIKRLREFFAGYVMNDLERSDIEAYRAQREATTWRGRMIKPATVRRELGTLSSAINWVKLNKGWEIPNPVEGARPQPGKNRVRWLTPEEWKQLANAMKQQKSSPWLYDFGELAINTGMRKMELLSLPWSRVDLRNNCIYLNPEDQKNAKYGAVPLNKGARRAILRRMTWLAFYYPDSPWVFPSRQSKRGKKHMQDVRIALNKALEAAGIDDFSAHDFRHTFASWLVQKGVPLYHVQQVLRHADIRQTEKYAHLAPDVARQAVAALDEELKNKKAARYPHADNNAAEETSQIIENIIEKSTG